MSDRCETAAGPQMGTCVPIASECLIQSGAVFVYGRNKDEWIPTAYIKSAYPETPDDFGGCLAMHGETLVSTGTGEGSHASGVGGDQTNNSQARAGAAFVFHRRSAPPVVPTFCGH